MRHRRRALLPLAERLGDLGDLRPSQVADLDGEALERGGDERQRRQQRRVPVARQHLRRGRLRTEPQPLAREALQFRIGRSVGADRTGELAHPHPFECLAEALASALELECPARELQPERCRLGVDAVGAPDANRVAVLKRPRDHRLKRPLDPVDEQRPGFLHLQRQAGVDHVGRGQPVVEPAAFRAKRLRDRVHERCGVVVKRRLELRHALGAGWLSPLLDGPNGVRRDAAELAPGRKGR